MSEPGGSYSLAVLTGVREESSYVVSNYKRWELVNRLGRITLLLDCIEGSDNRDPIVE